jgi:hypothetical protein
MTARLRPGQLVSLIVARVAGSVTLTVTLLCARSHQGTAQSPVSDTASVPRALVNAWLASRIGYGTSVHVATLPDALRDRFVIPPRSRVVGTIENYAVSIVVLDVPTSPDSVRAYMVRELPKAGWRAAPTPKEGGFRSVDADEKSWCRGANHVALVMEPRGGRQTMLALTSTAPPYSSECPQQPRDENSLPVLFDPKDSFPGERCRDPMRYIATSSSTVLSTTTTYDSLLNYYGRQLRDSGWTVPAPSTEGPFVTRSWAKRLPDGKLRVATIYVSNFAARPDCRFISLSVETKPPS